MLNSIFTPQAFKYDPYGWYTNQNAHFILGLRAYVYLCGLAFIVTGEFPVREYVVLLILVFYAAFEIGIQRWQGIDTVVDTWFVGLGAYTVATVFLEYNTGDGSFIGYIQELYLPAILFEVTLIVGYVRRYLNIKRRQKSFKGMRRV